MKAASDLVMIRPVHPILNILKMGTQYQVRRVDARGVVADVSDHAVLGDIAMRQPIRHAVRPCAFRAEPQQPVAKRGCTVPGPEPTFIRTTPIDLCPKARLNVHLRCPTNRNRLHPGTSRMQAT